MQLFKRQQTRLLCFILLLIAVLMLCNRLLVKTDTSRYLMLEELQGEEGFQIAFVGSSPVYYSIDPDIIEKDTGFKSIDAAIGNAGLESCGALINTFLRKESAQMVILTLEPQMLIEEIENPEAEVRLMPGLHHLRDKAAYLWDLCRTDQRWMSRLFYFRSLPVSSWDDFVKTLTIKYRTEQYRLRMESELSDTPYRGKGYHEMLLVPPEGGLAQNRSFVQGNDHIEELPMINKDRILKMARNCAARNIRFVIVIPPCLKEYIYSQPHYMEACLLLEQFCQENQIRFYNLMQVKTELLPGLQERYVDIYHFDHIGAEIYSRFMGQFILAMTEDASIEDWFRKE